MDYRQGAPDDGEHARSLVLSIVAARLSWRAILAGVATAAVLQIMLALASVSLDFAARGLVDAQDHESLRDDIAVRFDLSEDEPMQIDVAWMAQLDESAETLREVYEEAMATAREAVSGTAKEAAEAAGGAALAMLFGQLAATPGALPGRPEALMFDETADAATPAA